MTTSLNGIYQSMSSLDAEMLEKQAAEKYAADEEEAAGKIMARGFMDELNKLAEWGMPTPTSIPSKPLATGGGATGGNVGFGKRKAAAPPTPAPPSGSVTGGPNATMTDQKGKKFNTSTSTQTRPPGIGGK